MERSGLPWNAPTGAPQTLPRGMALLGAPPIRADVHTERRPGTVYPADVVVNLRPMPAM